jgi:chaperonin GroES
MINDLDLQLDVVLRSHNVSPLIDKDTLDQIGQQVVESFDSDRQSRAEWEKRNDLSLKLALQVVEKKTFPWPDAANVKFPLLTIAAIQYHSRAYPALINGPQPVACRTMAPSPTPPELPDAPAQAQQILQQAQQEAAQKQQASQQGGGQQQQEDPKQAQQKAQAVQQAQQQVQAWQKQVDQIKQKAKKEADNYAAAQLRARRIREHMSYQILEEDPQWEEEMDKLLLIQSIAGCAFKKTFFDPVGGVNRSECVGPRELVVSYYTKNLETSPRTTHIIPMFRNDVIERQIRGVFNEFTDAESLKGGPTYSSNLLGSALNTGADDREGVFPNPSDVEAPYELLEQHCWIDMDGDGYKEPYIVTVRYDTRQVLRIVARFTTMDIEVEEESKRIIRITPTTYFTKYPFIPSPDGGFYDIGFGSLLGPINHSIDTALNQLLDAGSLSNAGGGFLGRGFKGRKGDMRFKLGEWKQTDSTGDDLHKSIFPLPVKEPSVVLFNLLGLLIQYGQQVAGATDVMQGQAPGQNTPAETSRNTLEQGMKVFNGIYKRTHRALTQELRKLFDLNKVFLADGSKYYTPKEEASSKIFQADYSGPSSMVRPSADAFYMSDSQRLNQATAVLQASTSQPGYNRYLANKHYLESLKVSDVDDLLPDPKGPNAIPTPPNPQVQLAQMDAQIKQMGFQIKLKEAQLKIAANAEKVQAEIRQLNANAQLLTAQAQGVDTGHQIALINTQIAAKRAEQDGQLRTLEVLSGVMKDHSDIQQAQLEQAAPAALPSQQQGASDATTGGV